MIYPESFETKIGFVAIRNLLLDYCEGALAKEEARKMHFSFDYDDVVHQLRCVEEMKIIQQGDSDFPAISTVDITHFLKQIKVEGSFISAENLVKVQSALQSQLEIRNFFDKTVNAEEGNMPYKSLFDETSALKAFPSLLQSISAIINKFGEIKDTASPKLYEIRQSIKRAEGSVHRAMSRVIDSAVAAGIVEKDVTPAMRDGRMVLPVQAANKRQLSGIVHDQSATGKTVFIEPAEVVEMSNRLRELQLDQQREIVAILISLSDILRPEIDDILQSCIVLGKLEFIQAKARIAVRLNASLPHINAKPELEIYNGRHPSLQISLNNINKEIVPLNIHLTKKDRILIISGPNAGGKSVTIKTVAILQYMMQCGMLPTVDDNSHMGIFKNLFIDIGDEQSFENDLSTYSSHLKNMRFFLQYANRFTLLFADEMGSGTEPQIGGAIAQSILMQLAKSGCFGIITTHYHNLKTLAESSDGFVNGAMLYDRARLQPTFQLSIGNPGSSFAVDIAHKMGLPKEVIDEAKQLVGSEYVNIDKYLSEIARDRKYWASKRANIKEREAKLQSLIEKYESNEAELKSQRKMLLSEARKEAEEILNNANARIERTILEIRKAQAEKDKTKQLRQQLKDFAEKNKRDSSGVSETSDKTKKRKPNKEADKTVSVNKPSRIEVGGYVTLDGSSTVGQVLSIHDNKADVAFGSLRTTVEISRLKTSSRPKSSQTNAYSLSTSSDSRERQLNFNTEIDVRGMRADEAIQAVTYFIDDAIQFSAGKVRILHGTGHGILKTLIRQQLKANPAVSSFHDEDIRFGGAGITVVEID